MTELRGGERVEIFDNVTGYHLQTFERAMSEAMERHVEAEGAPNVIDVWRLVTPMSTKQKRKLQPLPKVDLSAPLSVQTGQVGRIIRRIVGRERINARSKEVKVERRVSDHETRVEYRLGHGIPIVGIFVLWDILDEIARQGRQHIGNTDLARRITGAP